VVSNNLQELHVTVIRETHQANIEEFPQTARESFSHLDYMGL